LLEYYIKKKDLQTLKVIYFIGLLDYKNVIKDNYIFACIFSLNQISKDCNLSTKEIIQILKKMAEKSIKIDDVENGIVKYIPIVSYMSVSSIKDEIRVYIHYDIYSKFQELTERYTFLLLGLMLQTKYKYTLKIISFLQTIEYSTILSLDDINRILDTKYKRFSSIEKILEKVREEIELYSTISFLFEVNYIEESKPRKNKKAVSITFVIKKNKPKKSKDNTPKIQEFLSTLKKMKKNKENRELSISEKIIINFNKYADYLGF